MKKGTVVLCRVPMPSTQLLEFKMRPGVVVSKESNNKRLKDIIIAVCTSNVSRPKEATHVFIFGEDVKMSGIRVPSVVRCESLFTINKSMILRALGKLPTRLKNELDECLKDALELK
ncbi:MAG: type II toxin-antitoxin system PemK/MazF family toxin [Ignavibacteriae bacterium]|nr:type II toxin-antitoxin system PemK/MazF family toxin [Ignavibacteriota bacterium]